MTKNKKQLVFGIIFACLGVALFVLGLVYSFKNMAFTGEYEWGSDSVTIVENDYVEAFLGAGSLFTSITVVGLVSILFAAYLLFTKEFKELYIHLYTALISAVIAIEGASYSILFADKIISRLSKAEGKLDAETPNIEEALSYINEMKEYPNPATYVLLAVIFSVVLGVAITKLISLKKKEC